MLHNLISTADHPDAILAEFLDNYRHLRQRKNGNALYHEILSFSPEDRPHLTPAILEDLTRHYIQLRCPDALVYARAHLDTDHPHVHLLISANNLGAVRPHRLSRTAFGRAKQELEQYQKKHYPQIRHSLAQTNAKSPPERRSESELNRRLARGGRHSRKAQIRQLMQETLVVSDSVSSFATQIRLLGFDLYRRGNTVGVVDQAANRRYRLRTLGLLDAYEELVRRLASTPEPQKSRRLADLAQLRSRTSPIPPSRTLE